MASDVTMTTIPLTKGGGPIRLAELSRNGLAWLLGRAPGNRPATQGAGAPFSWSREIVFGTLIQTALRGSG